MMTSLRLLLVVATVLCISDAIVIQPEYLNLTARIYSHCPSHIDGCPETSDEVEGRLLCMYYPRLSCPSENMHYFCGIDSKTQILVEDCFPLNSCAKGSKNAVRLDLKSTGSTASLECVQCGNTRIQRQPHESNMRFTSECDDSRMNIDFYNKLHNMQLVETRWPYDYDLYACDYKLGYSNKYRSSLCDASSLCECIADKKCTDPHRPELLPNGECDAVCRGDRDPFKNFRCQTTSEDSITVTQHVTDQQHKYETKDKTQKHLPIGEENESSPVVLIGILIGLCLLSLVAVAMYCVFPERIQVITNYIRAYLTCITDENTKVNVLEGQPFVKSRLGGKEDERGHSESDLSSVVTETSETDARQDKEKDKQILKQTFKENNQTKVEIEGKGNTYTHIENHIYYKPAPQQEREVEEKHEGEANRTMHPEQFMGYFPSN